MLMRQMLVVPRQYLFAPLSAAHFSTTESGAHDPRAIKELRFSAFNKEGKERDYNVRDEWKKRVALTKPQPFVPKPEYSRLQFDPNVRHRMPEISNDTLYRMVGNYVPQKDPQSCYVAI